MAKNGQMQGLLTEFRGVYEGRLRRLDEADRQGEDTQKVLMSCNNFYIQIKLNLIPKRLLFWIQYVLSHPKQVEACLCYDRQCLKFR